MSAQFNSLGLMRSLEAPLPPVLGPVSLVASLPVLVTQTDPGTFFLGLSLSWEASGEAMQKVDATTSDDGDNDGFVSLMYGNGTFTGVSAGMVNRRGYYANGPPFGGPADNNDSENAQSALRLLATPLSPDDLWTYWSASEAAETETTSTISINGNTVPLGPLGNPNEVFISFEGTDERFGATIAGFVTASGGTVSASINLNVTDLPPVYVESMNLTGTCTVAAFIKEVDN